MKLFSSGDIKDNAHQGQQEGKAWLHLLHPVTPKKNNEHKTPKALSRQLLARAHQKNNQNSLKGYLMTCTTGLSSDAETSGGKHKQKTADNIEIPAKDNNITGGNLMDILSYTVKN